MFYLCWECHSFLRNLFSFFLGKVLCSCPACMRRGSSLIAFSLLPELIFTHTHTLSSEDIAMLLTRRWCSQCVSTIACGNSGAACHGIALSALLKSNAVSAVQQPSPASKRRGTGFLRDKHEAIQENLDTKNHACCR